MGLVTEGEARGMAGATRIGYPCFFDRTRNGLVVTRPLGSSVVPGRRASYCRNLLNRPALDGVSPMSVLVIICGLGGRPNPAGAC